MGGGEEGLEGAEFGCGGLGVGEEIGGTRLAAWWEGEAAVEDADGGAAHAEGCGGGVDLDGERAAGEMSGDGLIGGDQAGVDGGGGSGAGGGGAGEGWADAAFPDAEVEGIRA